MKKRLWRKPGGFGQRHRKKTKVSLMCKKPKESGQQYFEHNGGLITRKWSHAHNRMTEKERRNHGPKDITVWLSYTSWDGTGWMLLCTGLPLPASTFWVQIFFNPKKRLRKISWSKVPWQIKYYATMYNTNIFCQW